MFSSEELKPIAKLFEAVFLFAIFSAIVLVPLAIWKVFDIVSWWMQ